MMSIKIPTDPAKASALVQDITTSPEMLAELAKSSLTFLREGVAVHPNSPPELLLALLPNELKSEIETRIAHSLVKNPKAPAKLLALLLTFIKPEMVNGSRRENWGYEDLAVKILNHDNCPVEDANRFLTNMKLPRKLKAKISLTKPSM